MRALARKAEGQLAAAALRRRLGGEHALRLQRTDCVSALDHLQHGAQLVPQLVVAAERHRQPVRRVASLGDEARNRLPLQGALERCREVLLPFREADEHVVGIGVSRTDHRPLEALPLLLALRPAVRGSLFACGLGVRGAEDAEVVGASQPQRVRPAGGEALVHRLGAAARHDAIGERRDLLLLALQVADPGHGPRPEALDRAQHRGRAGPAVEVTDVRLDRGQLHWTPVRLAVFQLRGQRPGLDYVRNRVTRSVGVDHSDRLGRQAGALERVADRAPHGDLGGGHHRAALGLGRAVHGVNHGVDVVSVPARLVQPLEQVHHAALADQEPGSPLVEGVRRGLGHRAERTDSAGERVAELLVQPAADHQVDLAEHQLVDRRNQRGQARGTGRVDREVGPVQVELVGHPARGHIRHPSGQGVLGDRRVGGRDRLRSRGQRLLQQIAVHLLRARALPQRVGVLVEDHRREDHREVVVVHRTDADADLLGCADVEARLGQQPIRQIQPQDLGRRYLGDCAREDLVPQKIDLVVVQLGNHARGDPLVLRAGVVVILPAQLLRIHLREGVAPGGHVVPELVHGLRGRDAAADAHHRDLTRDLRARGRRPVALRLLENRVVVDASESARRHRGDAQPVLVRLPRRDLCRDLQVLALPHRVRRQLAVVGHVRVGGVLHRQHGLDQTRHPGRGLEVSDLALDAAQQQRVGALAILAVDHRDRVVLVGVAHDRRGGVRLQVLDVGMPRLRALQGVDHRLGSPFGRRRVDRLSRAVRRGADPADHGPNPISVRQRVLEQLDHHHPGALADHETVRGVIKRTGDALAAQAVHTAEPDIDRGVGAEVGAPGDRHLRVAGLQGEAGRVERDERGGAGGVDGHVVAADPEHLGHAVGDRGRHRADRGDAGVPAMTARLELFFELLLELLDHLGRDSAIAQLLGQRAKEGVTLQRDRGVGEHVDTAGADQGYRVGQGLRARLDPGVFQRLPGSLEGDQLRRIDALHALGRQLVVQKRKLEILDERADVGIALLRPSRIRRIEVVDVPDPIGHPLEKALSAQNVLPVLFDIVGGRENASHPHDRDVVSAHLFTPERSASERNQRRRSTGP